MAYSGYDVGLAVSWFNYRPLGLHQVMTIETDRERGRRGGRGRNGGRGSKREDSEI